MPDARHPPAPGSVPGSVPGFDWDRAEDLTGLPEPELRGLLARVVEEERAAAYRREVLRGRANLIRTELAGRGLSGLSGDELARVLLGEEGGAG